MNCEVIVDDSDEDCEIVTSAKDNFSKKLIQVIDDGEQNYQVNNFIRQLTINDKPIPPLHFIKKMQEKDNSDTTQQNNQALKQLLNDDFNDYSDLSEGEDDQQGVQEIFYMPANFPELIDRQVEKLQRQIQKVIELAQVEIIEWMNNFSLRCQKIREVYNQFDSIKSMETVQQKAIKAKVSKANKNSKFLCKLIAGITDKFQILDDELVRVRNQFYQKQRRTQLEAAGIMQLRKDKIFYYKKNQTHFQCPMCVLRSSTISSLVAHLRKFHRINCPEGFVCLHCNKQFDVVSKLSPHVWTNHREKRSNDVFTCLGCNQEFQSKFQTLDHVPKCVYYCAAANHVMRLQSKQEVKMQDFQEFQDKSAFNLDDDDLQYKQQEQ